MSVSPAPTPPRRRGGTPAPRTLRGAGRGALWARGALALPGGYVVAACWAAALARALPGTTLDATLAATMVSFALHAGAAVWAFAARSVLRAATPLLGAGLLGALLAWLLRGTAA